MDFMCRPLKLNAEHKRKKEGKKKKQSFCRGVQLH